MTLIYTALPALRFVIALAIGYKVLSGLSWYDFARDVIARLPTPHPMTDDELRVWYEKQSGGNW